DSSGSRRCHRGGPGRARPAVREPAARCLPGQARGPAQAGHHGLAGRRRAQPRRRGVLLPPAGREPRGVLPLPARAQRPHVRGSLHPGPGGRRVPDRAAAAVRSFRRGHRPAARLRAQLLRRELRHGARAGLRLRDPPRVGLAGQARREPGQPARIRPLRRPRGLVLAVRPSCMSRIAGTLTTVNRLGDLERAIMDVLWETDTSLTVREVSARLTERNLAHTTVMTVLDRLAKKGFARRERDGRAWRYCPAATRETYVTELMLTALEQTGDRSAALARFAKSVSGAEASVLRGALDEIEGDGGG